MSFLAVLLALVVEQVRPLPRSNLVHELLVDWVRWVGRNFDAGRAHHAWVVWCITVLSPAVTAGALYLAVNVYSVLAAFTWSLWVLYLTLGFRQFSHYFRDIRDALDLGQEDRARTLLAQWRRVDASDLPRTELLRHVIEHSILAAHRHVFGVFFWFVVGSALGVGPTGAVIYRMAEFMARYWSLKQDGLGVPSNPEVLRRAQQAFAWVDWIPARLTAFGFAVVGNFEDAVDTWRRFASMWPQRGDGILLSAAAGAMGVALGGRDAPVAGMDGALAIEAAGGELPGSGSTSGTAPQLTHLRSVVGLVWRSVVLWMLLLALLSLAHLVG